MVVKNVLFSQVSHQAVGRKHFRQVPLFDVDHSIRTTLDYRYFNFSIFTGVYTITRDVFNCFSLQQKMVLRKAVKYVRGNFTAFPLVEEGFVEGLRCALVRGERNGHTHAKHASAKPQKCCFVCRMKEEPTIHHIVPYSRGGRSCRDNYARLCRDCHESLEIEILKMERNCAGRLCYADYIGVLAEAALKCIFPAPQAPLKAY